MSGPDYFNRGGFSQLVGSLHFPASMAVSFANRIESATPGVFLHAADERAILGAAERLEQAACSLRETVATMKAGRLKLVAAE